MKRDIADVPICLCCGTPDPPTFCGCSRGFCPECVKCDNCCLCDEDVEDADD